MSISHISTRSLSTSLFSDPGVRDIFEAAMSPGYRCFPNHNLNIPYQDAIDTQEAGAIEELGGCAAAAAAAAAAVSWPQPEQPPLGQNNAQPDPGIQVYAKC
ncbi:hypothetical protein C8J57DRAFT_1234625 [Mycena rebaudengoi]|nr:hypothetical protein C8J57DRAFT_1234625 [Mycena rebaudengoi]